MQFFNYITTPGLGESRDLSNGTKKNFGQAKLSINANPLNGNLFVKDFSKTFIDRGFQFDVGFIYNSQANWQFNAEKSVEELNGRLNAEDSCITILEGDGHRVEYHYDVSRKCYVDTSYPEGITTLTYQAEGQWISWNSATNITEHYQNNKRIKSENADGNAINYEYDDQQRLQTITGASGQKLTLEYSSDKIEIYAIINNTKTLWMSYQIKDGKIEKTIIPVNDTENYTIDYHYKDGLLSSITQSDETELDFSFNAEHKIEGLTTGGSQSYTVEYNASKTIISDSLKNKAEFNVNPSGLLESYKQAEQTKIYKYDSENRLEKIIFSDKTYKTYEYDKLGHCSAITNRNKAKTLFNHDQISGLLLNRISIDENAKEVADFYCYKDKKQLAFTINANGSVTQFAYDTNGNCTSKKTFLKAQYPLHTLAKDQAIDPSILGTWCAQQNPAEISLTEWSYYPDGQKKIEITYANIDVNGLGIWDEFAGQQECIWDYNGNLTDKKRRLNQTDSSLETSRYDGLNRCIAEVNSLKQETTYEYKDNKQTTTFVPTGLKKTITRNTKNQILSTQETAVDCDKQNILSYDNAGRCYKVSKPNHADEFIVYDESNRKLYEIDKGKYVTKNIYDINNNITQKIIYKTPLETIDEQGLALGNWVPKLSGLCSTETFIYDTESQLVYFIDGENFITKNSYDAYGNLIAKDQYANALTHTPIANAPIDDTPESKEDRHTAYFYDAKHNIIAEQSPSGHLVAYKRNLAGDLVEKIATRIPLENITEYYPELLDPIIQKTKEIYKLDARGQCLAHTDSEQYVTTKTYDAAGRNTQTKRGTSMTDYQWDSLDRLEKQNQSNGLEIKNTYSAVGKIATTTKKDTLENLAARKHYYRYNAQGQVTSELTALAAATITEKSTAEEIELLWQTKSTQHVYNGAGLLLYTSDELKNKTYYYCNKAGEINFIINPLGSIIEYTYDALCKKPSITRQYAKALPEEQRVTLQGGELSTDLINLLAAQRTDEDSITTIMYDNRGLPLKVIDAESYSVSTTYDAFHLKREETCETQKNVFVKNQFTYDKKDRSLKEIRDATGLKATSIWEYQDTENAVFHTNPNSKTDKTYFDNLNRITTYVDALDNTTEMKWDERSRLSSITDARKNTTGYIYSADDRTTQITSADGNKTTLKQNAFNENTEKTIHNATWKTEYEVNGKMNKTVEPCGHETSKTYNICGHIENEVAADKTITHHEYDAAQTLTKTSEDINGNNRVTKYEPNAKNQIAAMISAGVRTETKYNKLGSIKEEVIDPNGLHLKSTYERNAAGKITEETRGNKTKILRTAKTIYNSLNLATSKIIDPLKLNLAANKTYDLAGNIVIETDAYGNSTHIVYDANNQERFRINPLGAVTEKIYDANGNCIQTREYKNKLTLSAITDYSLANIEIAVNTIHNPNDIMTLYAYDIRNNLSAELKPGGLYTQYTNNPLGKKTFSQTYANSVKVEDFPKAPEVTVEDRKKAWFYNDDNELIFAVSEIGAVTEYLLDENKVMIGKCEFAKSWLDYQTPPDLKVLTSPDDRFTHYIHDTLGRCIFDITPLGIVTEYTYDDKDKILFTYYYPQPIIFTEHNEQAIREKLPADKTAIPHTENQYDAAGRKFKTIDKLGDSESFKLNALGELKTFTDKEKLDWKFKYDKAGRKILEETPRKKILSFKTEINDIKEQYSATDTKVTKKTDYDTQGNVTITEAFGTPEARSIALSYDACKNLVSTSIANVSIDDENQTPKLIVEEEKSYFSYFTDYFNSKKTKMQRAENSISAKTTTLYNAQNQPVVMRDEAGELSFKVYNNLGKLKYSIDAEHNLTEYNYNQFGEISEVKHYAEPLKFIGENYDTGLTEDDIKSLFKISTQDRFFKFSYDKAGRKVLIEQPQRFQYTVKDGRSNSSLIEPKTQYSFNNFNERVSEIKLANNEKISEKSSWYDADGQLVAELDALKYLTTYKRNRNNKIVEKIYYACALPASTTSEKSLAELIKQIKPSKDDRKWTYQYNVRDELTHTTQHDIVLNAINESISRDLTTEFMRDVKGRIVKTTLPDESFTVTEYNEIDLPVLQTGQLKQIEIDDKVIQATPVKTFDYNAFGQLSRVNKHANGYENAAYLTAHPDDQITRNIFDNRGLQTADQKPNGVITHKAYDANKNLAREWLWVTGWADKNTPTQRLRQTKYNNNRIGNEVEKQECLTDATPIITASKWNAFGEKTQEGPGDDTYPVYWKFDNCGNLWSSNSNKGYPELTLHDLHGHESAILQSKNHDLSQQEYESLNEASQWDYQNLLRIELEKNAHGHILRQNLPAYKTLKENTPELFQNLAVTCGNVFPEFGKTSLSWPAPEEKALTAKTTLWPKGQPEKAESRNCVMNPTRWGADVSDLVTDEYEFSIDLYYSDEMTGTVSAAPRYRTTGNTIIKTEHQHKTDSVIYEMENDSTLLLIGGVKNITGVELSQNGTAISRIAITSTDQDNMLRVNLGECASGEYQFRLLRENNFIEEKPLSLGIPSSTGTRLDAIQTQISEGLAINAINMNSTVSTSWSNLPPQVSNLYQSLVVLNANGPHADPRKTFANYINDTVDHPVANGGAVSGFNNAIMGGFYSFFKFSSTIVKNDLYTIDANQKVWPIAKFVNPLVQTQNPNPTYLYLQTGAATKMHAIREHFSDDTLGKTYALDGWINGSYRCLAPSGLGQSSFDLISLDKSHADENIKGSFTLHTTNRNSNKLIVREIGLTNIKTSKILNISSQPPTLGGYSDRVGLKINWQLPEDLNTNLLHANFSLHFNHPLYVQGYGPDYTFDYLIGKANHAPHNAQLMPFLNKVDPNFKNFDLTRLSLQLNVNDEWIPLFNAVNVNTDLAVASRPFTSSTTLSSNKVTKDIVSNSYNEGDISTFPDIYTLMFYPLPANIAKFDLEYLDTSLSIPTWRVINNTSFNGHSISAPVGDIPLGNYPFRLRMQDAANTPIDLSGLATPTADKWVVGEFSVKRGTKMTNIVSQTQPESATVVKPSRSQIVDRWGNALSTTNTLNQTIDFTHNKANSLLSQTDPEIEITEENGTKVKLRPKTDYAYHTNQQVIAMRDANGNTTTHERDPDGTLLKTTRADGVFRRFGRDIFGREVSIRNAFNYVSRKFYDLCNHIVSFIDPNQWKTKFTYNELGLRHSKTDGNEQTQRYDYAQPLSQPTHQYLPQGQLTKTQRDRSGLTLNEKFADGGQNSWERNYFGTVLKHTDLSGAIYDYSDVNFMNQLNAIKSSGGNHGMHQRIDGESEPVKSQDIKYLHDEAAHTIATLDDANGITSRYRFNTEGQCVRETFVASDGKIHQAVNMIRNAKGWLTRAEDTVMQANYGYDAVGNRRCTQAKIFWDELWQPVGVDNWYTYNKANSMLINQGTMSPEGKIIIAPNKGAELSYNEIGWRKKESRIDDKNKRVDKDLDYFANGLLKSTHDDKGQKLFKYDGQLPRRVELQTPDMEEKSHITPNGWTDHQTSIDHKQKMKTNTDYTLSERGLPTHQTVSVRNDSGSDGYNDDLATEYVNFDDPKISKTSGTRKRVDGDESKVATVTATYDPNSFIETVQGQIKESFRRFTVNSEGRIINKETPDNKKERYFYTTQGQMLGRFGNIPPDAKDIALGTPPSDINFDLNYHPADENFPPPAPEQYKVEQGDTFELISEKMYGDRSFADLIANENGYSHSDPAPEGTSLQIPNLVNTNIHNWEGLYTQYNAAAIIGSLYPNMPTPERHFHRPKINFFHILAEAIAGALIMSLAPGIGLVLFGEGLFSEILGFAIAGAASSLAQQEAAVLFGDQQSISWHAVGESALLAAGTAGLSKGISSLPINSNPVGEELSFTQRTMQAAELALSKQALTIAISKQKFDWNVLAASVASGIVDANLNQFIDPGNTSHLLTNVADTSAEAEINHLVNKTPMDVEAIAAQSLGTYIGTELGQKAKDYFKEYQVEKIQREEKQLHYVEGQHSTQHEKLSLPFVDLSTDITLDGEGLDASSRYLGDLSTRNQENTVINSSKKPRQDAQPNQAANHSDPDKEVKNQNILDDRMSPKYGATGKILAEFARQTSGNNSGYDPFVNAGPVEKAVVFGMEAVASYYIGKKIGAISGIARYGMEAWNAVSKLGLFGNREAVVPESLAGAESVAEKFPNPLQEVLKNAKPTPGKPNQLEAVLDDGSKVIFRRDIGEHSHPIGKDYPNPVDHYNIEIHAANPARPGKFTSQENVHIVVDDKFQPGDIFLKDKTRIIINSERNKLGM